MNRRQLKEELRDISKDINESEELLSLANELQDASLPQLSRRTHSHISSIPGKHWQLNIYKFAASGATAIFIGLILISQAKDPKSWFHSITNKNEQTNSTIQQAHPEIPDNDLEEVIQQPERAKTTPIQPEEAPPQKHQLNVETVKEIQSSRAPSTSSNMQYIQHDEKPKTLQGLKETNDNKTNLLMNLRGIFRR